MPHKIDSGQIACNPMPHKIDLGQIARNPMPYKIDSDQIARDSERIKSAFIRMEYHSGEYKME